MIDINSFNEITKAQRASVGEIRVWSDGKKYIKTSKGWVLAEKKDFYKKKDVIWHESKFGKNYSQFENKPKEALDFLIDKKEGQVKNAWERDDIGDIDIVYGKKHFGLNHIIDKHVGITEDGKEKDFKDEEEMSSIIDTLLRKGDLVKDFVDVNGHRKRILSLGRHTLVITQTIVVDDEDNFKEKRWIVTSYDPTRTIEEKGIRKAVSEETALEKSLGCNTPNNSVFQHGLSSVENKSHFSLIDSFNKEESGRSCSSEGKGAIDSRSLSIQRKKDAPLVAYSSISFSAPKDTTNLSIEQQFMDEIIEKAKKSSPIGTEKTWGSKVYVKTANGWRPKGKGKSSKKDEQQPEAKTVKVDYSQHASKASDEQLQAAINDKDASPEVKQAAQKEIENRKGKVSDDKSANELGITSALQRILDAQEKGELDLDSSVLDKIKEKLAKNKEAKETKPIDEKILDSKLDKLKQDISDSIDKKLNEMNGFKKITQTYVKVDGQTIVLNMKGEDKYKAKKGSFYMESKPNEPLNEFKKRVKEEFEKTLKKEESNPELKVESKEPEQPKVEEKAKKPVVKMDSIKSQAGVIMYGKILQKLDEGKAVEFTENGIDYRFSRDENKGEYLLEDLSNNKSTSWPQNQGAFVLKNKLEKLDTKEEKNDVKFEAEKEFEEFLKKRNSQNSTLDKEQKERFGKILDSVTVDENIEKRFKNYLEDEDFEQILSEYSNLESTQRAEVNKVLIDSGYLPIANGVLYSEWNGVKYKHFTGHILEDQENMKNYYKEQGKKLKVTDTQSKALRRYMANDYEIIRDYNYGKGGGSNVSLMAQAIASAIDKNPCKENLVLYRRLELREINSLNELLNAEVGSIIEDKSFGSFSLKQMSVFGSDFQITLLAKKGDKVANINNTIGEYEYLTQRLSKFKVLAKGLNSIVVEMV
nr:MAG TPA: VIP2 [Caudoviricetes sp.]